MQRAQLPASYSKVMSKGLALAALIIGVSSLSAETFTKPSNQRPDYSAYATGPSLQIDGISYSFLPQARAERSSRAQTSRLPVPKITLEGANQPTVVNEFQPEAVSSNGDQLLASKGRYDIYLSVAPQVTANSVGSANSADCGYCQVVVSARTGGLALFTNELVVNLDTNSRQFAEQLADANGLRLKYYMGRMALAVFEAPDAQSALQLAPTLAAHPEVSKASNSVVEHEYHPQ